MDIWIYGYGHLMNPLQFSFNFRQMFVQLSRFRRIFVEFSSIFRRLFVHFLSNFVKMSDLLFKCRQNVVNLGPWAKNWKANEYYTHKYTYTYTYTYVYLYTYTLYLTCMGPGPAPGPGRAPARGCHPGAGPGPMHV